MFACSFVFPLLALESLYTIGCQELHSADILLHSQEVQGSVLVAVSNTKMNEAEGLLKKSLLKKGEQTRKLCMD